MWTYFNNLSLLHSEIGVHYAKVPRSTVNLGLYSAQSHVNTVTVPHFTINRQAKLKMLNQTPRP